MKRHIPASNNFSALSPALFLLAFALSAIPSAGFAQGTPDGQPPSEETACDGLDGAEYGICNAYCEATDCGDGVNYADMKACAALQRNWERKTGLTDLPCDCSEGEVLGEEGCVCAYDLVISITGFDNSCPTGAGSCVFEADIEVENIGSEDITDSFDAVVTALGVSDSAMFPGLNAGAVDAATISIPTGDNCFDPNCEVEAVVDFTDEILECDETNNEDADIFLG